MDQKGEQLFYIKWYKIVGWSRNRTTRLQLRTRQDGDSLSGDAQSDTIHCALNVLAALHATSLRTDTDYKIILVP
jgi:hypothetical protein